MVILLSSSEQISIGLGVLSVLLGVLAISQAFFYKKEQERQAKVQDAFLREQRINMSYACIRNREIYRNTCTGNKVILRKDRAILYATSSFRPNYVYKNLDEIKKLLKEVLKDCYTTGIISALEKHDINKGDVIHVVNIRSECDLNYLNRILEANDSLEEYGLYLSLMIE